MEVATTLAYYDMVTIQANLDSITSGGCSIKLFMVVIFAVS
jgi:hypothetical protein